MSDSPIHVWRLEGHKAGDNAQLRFLSQALEGKFGWTSTAIPMEYRPHELLLHGFSQPSLAGITASCRQQFTSPWPNLVLTAGRRNELPARWLAVRTGAQVIHVGRPWSDPGNFDLILTTPQYQVPAGANVLSIPFPLVPPKAIQPVPELRQRLKHFPRPFSVILVGGNSGPHVFDSQLGRHLAIAVNEFITQSQGSALVVTSRRTPRQFTRQLNEDLHVPTHLFEWNAPKVLSESYDAILSLGDNFIVTADSVSMVADAMTTGQPTRLFDIEAYPPTGWQRLNKLRWKPLAHELAQRLAPTRMHRHVRQLLQSWVDEDYVEWLQHYKNNFKPQPLPFESSVNSALNRIGQLVS